MTGEPDAAQVARYAAAVRAAAAQVYGAEAAACLETTRVGLEIARARGWRMRPQPVRALARNARHVATGGRTGWSVAIVGTGEGNERTGRWDGHLVGMLGPWLVDFTAEQLSRPRRRLPVTAPIVVPATVAELAVGVTAHLDGGVQVQYASIDSTRWRTARGWVGWHSEALAEAVGLAERLMGGA